MNGFPSMKVTMLAVMMAYASAPMTAFSEEKSVEIDKVEVIGILPERLESVPGSFTVIDKEALAERRPFSIQEALIAVPGVNIVGENAFGLGLNIGIRGLNPRRTSRTLVMEDGVPLQLGPYGDPSLHLTTPMERVDRIEVVKGSGQILYGPQTVGGMINFVTRAIPTDGKVHGTAQAMIGNNDFKGAYANIGFGDERGGVMLDVNHKEGDGIRKNHDFEVQDVTLKGQLNFTDSQRIIAKIGYYKEDSNVSETGLNAAAYAADKFQAPTGRNDQFELERKSAQLTHIFDITDTVKLTTNAYYVDVFRSSFRQQDNPTEVLERCPTGVSNTNFANADQCGGRHRPRDFQYWGIEPRLDFQHELFGLKSDAVIGFRYHEEDQKRRQYRGNDARAQSLSFLKANAEQPGVASAVADFREDIRIAVEAKSYYFQNTFYAGDFAITPGVRYEDIDQKTTILQAGGNTAFATQTNNQSKVLPGFGVAWNGIANTTVFGGVHKGFAPPRASRDLDGTNISATKPEESTNYELGLRSAYYKGVTFESTLFQTKFDEIVIEQPAGRFVNAGESEQTGIEFAGRVDFGTIYNTPHNFYLAGNYTNLFTADFEKGPDQGNRLQYAPKHIASLSVGYQNPVGFDIRLGADYVSEQFSDSANTRVENAAGTQGTIPSYTLFNMSANYRPVGSKVSYFLSGYNLTDREFLTSRVDGKVAGRQRQVFAGIRFDF